jgi:hypothetical protein
MGGMPAPSTTAASILSNVLVLIGCREEKNKNRKEREEPRERTLILLGFQSRRAAVTETQNRPAKANRPAMILIREAEPFQRVGRAAGFG